MSRLPECFIRGVRYPDDGDRCYVMVACADGRERYAHSDHAATLVEWCQRASDERHLMTMLYDTPQEAEQA